MSDPRPRLHTVTAPDTAEAVVLVLHGGREVGPEPATDWQPAVLRMIPFGRRTARLGQARLAVYRLRFALRGWNGQLASPVGDAEWALTELGRRHPGLAIGLIGHSMGGRTALRVAGADQVTTVVGLAPWIPKGEPLDQLHGRHVLLAHGTEDTMTSPGGSAWVAATLRNRGEDATFLDVRGERHPMLRRPRFWHDLAAGFTVCSLLGVAPEALDQSVEPSIPNLLTRVIGGETRISA